MNLSQLQIYIYVYDSLFDVYLYHWSLRDVNMNVFWHGYCFIFSTWNIVDVQCIF